MVTKESYYSPSEKRYYFEHELGEDKTVSPNSGEKLTIKVEKMSKSKNNGVDPNKMIEQYGADTVRLFCLFASPPEKDLEWSEDGVEGAFRFLNRVFRTVNKYADRVKKVNTDSIDSVEMTDPAKKVRIKTHKTIKKITEDYIERYRFNTGIAMLMELVNEISSFNPETDGDFIILKEAYTGLLRCLFPVCPHLAEELHSDIGYEGSVYDYEWPKYHEDLTKDETVEYVFQVNGKTRGKVEMPAGLKKEELEELALQNDNVKRHTEGKDIRKIIIVPNKLVNIVAK
jgi:leucyl-tRNA synthetase